MIVRIAEIADIHFGVSTSLTNKLYINLKNNFINKLKELKPNIIAICGDLFDSKLSLNSTNDLAVNGTLYTGKVISNGNISGQNATFTNVNAGKIIFTSEGSTTELYQDGLTYNGKTYSWANIAGGTVKAVFGA